MSFFDEECDDCEPQPFYEENCHTEILMGEDSAELEVQFSHNSEAGLYCDIAWSPTTIEYYSAPPVIIGTLTRKHNKSTTHLNSFA